MRLSSSDLELIYDDKDDQTVGMRFENISLTRGAVITNAYTQFTADEASDDITNLNIRAETSDNAAGFTKNRADV